MSVLKELQKSQAEDKYQALLEHLKAERDAAGRSERARRLSVAITELESSQLWFQHSEG